MWLPDQHNGGSLPHIPGATQGTPTGPETPDSGPPRDPSGGVMVDEIGFIKLYRKVKDNPVWAQCSPAVWKVFCACLLDANWAHRQWFDGANLVTLPPGSLVTSINSLSASANVTRQQVRDALDWLAKLQITTQRRTHRYTIITFTNWSTYQLADADENTVMMLEPTQLQSAQVIHDLEVSDDPSEPGTQSEHKEEHSENTAQAVETQEVTGLEILAGTQMRTLPKEYIELPLLFNSSGNTSSSSGSFKTCPTDGNLDTGAKPSNADAKARVDALFEAWWSHVWLKVGKRAARRAFPAALKRVCAARKVKGDDAAAFLITEADAEKERALIPGNEMRARMHPSTWLNGHRWEDEIREFIPRTPRQAAEDAMWEKIAKEG